MSWITASSDSGFATGMVLEGGHSRVVFGNDDQSGSVKEVEIVLPLVVEIIPDPLLVQTHVGFDNIAVVEFEKRKPEDGVVEVGFDFVERLKVLIIVFVFRVLSADRRLYVGGSPGDVDSQSAVVVATVSISVTVTTYPACVFCDSKLTASPTSRREKRVSFILVDFRKCDFLSSQREKRLIGSQEFPVREAECSNKLAGPLYKRYQHADIRS